MIHDDLGYVINLLLDLLLYQMSSGNLSSKDPAQARDVNRPRPINDQRKFRRETPSYGQ